MQKSIEFHVNGNDASLASIKAMLNGVATYMGDKSLVISERMVISVTTERNDVALVLQKLTTAKPAGQVSEKKTYKKRQKPDEASESEQ